MDCGLKKYVAKMAAEVIEILKKCVNKITSSSTKERRHVCEELLLPCIQKQDFSEAGVKAVIKLIFLTQHRYRDNQSRRGVEEVLRVLAEKQSVNAVKYFCMVFSDVEKHITSSAPSYVNSGSNLVLLCWSCVLARHVYSKTELCKDAQWIRLVQVQCLALHGVLSAGTACVCEAGKKKLYRVWREVPGITFKYAEAISKLEASQENCCLTGLLFNFCTKNKDVETIGKFKKTLLEMYVKAVINSKTRPSHHVLVNIPPLLSHVTHDDFSSLILPALQKSLLRNPEVVLESAAYLISSVSIDLSKYALDICKNTVGQLRAKEELHRQEAMLILKNLAHQCSDPGAMEELINYLFAVLNGSEGKLTQWNDRVGVLQGIKSLEHHSVSGNASVQALSQLVAEKLVKYLQQEVHEGAVVYGLSVLSHWCTHFSTQVPKVLVDAFKKGMTNKNSTTAVRTGYLQCMTGAFQGNTLLQGMEILPQLLQTIEKASGQPNQAAIVTEGLLAASILIRLSLADVQAESKLGSFWTTFLDIKKQLFVSDKFLNFASEEALLLLVSVIERLVLSHGQRLNKSNSQPWYRALVFLLTHSAWKVRQNAQSCVQRLFNALGESALELQCLLLKELSKLIAQQKHHVTDSSVPIMNGDAPQGGSPNDAGRTNISHRILVSSLCCLTLSLVKSNPDLSEETKDKIALQILSDAHHPAIVSYKGELWMRIVHSLGIETQGFVGRHLDAIMEMIVSSSTSQQCSQNMLHAMAGLAPKVILPRVVKHSTVCLAKPAFQQVTMEEHAILYTPEGEIHNTSVLESVRVAEAGKKQNMKKESKAYSYEDQLWEKDIRESIKKKKKAEGKLSEKDEMSQKEKEIFEAQLMKEAEIRDRLKELQREVVQVGSLLETAITANPNAMRMYTPTILTTLLPLLQSPLTAPVMIPVLVKLGKSAFNDDQEHLAELVGYVTLRLLKPMCRIDQAWCEEDLLSATKRVISVLHSTSVPDLNIVGSSSSDSLTELLSAPAFAFCFPFLRCVLRDGGKNVKGNEDLRQEALQIVAEHCKLRANNDDDDEEDEQDENDPALLPREEMLYLLTEIISTSADTIKGSRLQQLASLSLVELCKATSGEYGCTTAAPGEISVLLNSLESPAASLRFATLQGLLVLTYLLSTRDHGTSQTARLVRRLWVAKFDVDEENAKLAERLWQEVGFTAPEPLCSALLDDVVHDVEIIRKAAAPALAAAIDEHPDVASAILQQLVDLYDVKLKVPPLFVFFVPTGLGDHHLEVRKHMLNAALKAVNDHGKSDPALLSREEMLYLLTEVISTSADTIKGSRLQSPAASLQFATLQGLLVLTYLLSTRDHGTSQTRLANIALLLPVFEQFLDMAPDTSAHDTIRQSVIILMGSVELLGAMAFCAPKQLSSCLPSIVPRLCEVLTDSHMKVQKAGAQALRQIGSVIRNPEILAISSVLLEALMDPSTKTAPCLQVLLQTSFVHFIDAPSLALIMPVLQRALSERSTETKKMAAQIIGNMCSLTDKKDLAPYLGAVVPGLKQALLDPVPEVRAVSSRALGALVRGMGEECFEDLLPWLMETLTSENSSDLAPYLGAVVPGLKQVLLDPVPEYLPAPSVLWSCGMSEKCFEDLLPWLMEILTSENSNVDRSGAAQGLDEVLCAMGTNRLEKLMPEVISTTERVDLAPHVREGYLMLYIYLPSTFKDDFIPFVGPVIPSVLKGLADESEHVRDTSLKAGQRIVNLNANTAIELFLPELEKGLFDDNWRIRHSSVQLLGDLLYEISGVTGKMSTEGKEDDNFGTSQSNQAIIESLGAERRNRVLSRLYMGRSDVSLMVRQAALHVWKVVVPNTPRILREILPTLFSLLLGCLASTSYDKRQVAARTLGDLVRKLGERVLPEIIPILERGLDSDKSDERQGVCIGLSEIVSSTSKEQVIQYVDSLVLTVRRALIDPLPEVRVAAAKTFDQLHNTIGAKALDDILPDLLKKMDDPSLSEYALDGLRQVMAVKSRVVLPFLVPQLITPPVITRALAILSAVAGDALTRHLNRILPAIIKAIQDCFGTEHEKE
ncbi:hypothetical protein pdam_00022068, partial [Pocillopora damicornis]